MKNSILVLLIAFLVVAGCAAPSSPGASPTAPPTPTASPTAPPAARFEWKPATVPASDLNSASLAVLPGGDGLVAVGYDGAFGSILWTSTDGEVWRDVTPPDFKSAGLVSIVPFDGKLVAVGRGDTFDVDTELAAAWISEDGVAWRRVEGGPDMRGQMIDIVASDLGIFAVGGVPGDDAAGIWRSTDGETWERTGGDFEHAFMWSIAEGGPGLTVTGWRRNPEPDLAVWTSANGIDWVLAPDPEGFKGFEGTDVVDYDGALVMVGASLVGEREARIWTSADGIDWKIADVAVDLVDSTIRNLVVTPVGLVGLGGRGTDGAAWVSPDGRAWETLGNLVPDAYFNAAFVADGKLLVGGATQEGTLETGIDVYAKIWTAATAVSAVTGR